MDCKRSSSPTSADIIGGNEDLLIEILLFLPAEALIRFRCVSKHWHSLILSPRFSLLHTLHGNRPREPEPSLCVCSSTTSQFFVYHPNGKKLVPYLFKFLYQKVLQSCNGLFLIECRSSRYGKKDYFICNPTKRKCRKLVLRDDTGKYVRGLCIAFDPTKSPYYKVFCFRGYCYHRSPLWVEEYDSETRAWTEMVRISGGHFQPINGVYWNDAIYFIRSRGASYSLSFEDDSCMVNRIYNTPRVNSLGAKKGHVMESNGHLHYVVISLHPDKNYVYVFEWSKEVGGWFLKYRANLNPISATFAAKNGISLLGMIRGESERDSALWFHVPGKIMVYRFVEEIFEVLVDFTNECYFKEGQLQFLFKDAHQFIQTLAPP